MKRNSYSDLLYIERNWLSRPRTQRVSIFHLPQPCQNVLPQELEEVSMERMIWDILL